MNLRAYINRRSLWRTIAESVSVALQDFSQSEPQLVANMVFQIPRAVNALQLTAIQSGGVFVHQHPQAKCANFPKPKLGSVEIGDLLLLRTERRNGRIVSSSAFLLQAKKSARLLLHRPDNTNQHYLYARWPLFEYAYATRLLNGQKRQITGLDLYSASKYLLIGKNQPYFSANCRYCCPRFILSNHCCALTAHPTFPSLTHYRCFVGEMVDFILGNAGKDCTAPPPDADVGWNKVIEDLTTVTAKSASVYMGKASGLQGTERGQYLCFLSGDAFRILDGNLKDFKDKIQPPDGNVPKVPEEVSDSGGEENSGISIIEFVVTLDE
jgi:hypothetical protein